MELKIFRDTLPQAGASCTVKAELPLETEILISDLSAAGIQAGQMLCKTGGAAETAAARAADAGRLSALHRVLSGREWRRPMPDRTETALYKTVGSAGIFLHQLDGHGGRPDRISQLPGREPAPH